MLHIKNKTKKEITKCLIQLRLTILSAMTIRLKIIILKHGIISLRIPLRCPGVKF